MARCVRLKVHRTQERRLLTSLWQPHRKVKQRGGKTKSLRTPLGVRCAAGHKTHPPSPSVSFPGLSTRVADSVSKLWVHALEGSSSSWSTKREPTQELAKQQVTPSCTVRCTDASGVSDVHLAGDFMAKLHGVQFLAYFSSACVVKWPVAIGNPFTRVLAELAVPFIIQSLLAQGAVFTEAVFARCCRGPEAVHLALDFSFPFVRGFQRRQQESCTDEAANRAHSQTKQVSVSRRTLSRSTRH